MVREDIARQRTLKSSEIINGIQNMLTTSLIDEDDVFYRASSEIIMSVGRWRSLTLFVVDDQAFSISIASNNSDGTWSDLLDIRYDLNHENIVPTTARTGKIHYVNTVTDERLDPRTTPPLEKYWTDKVAIFIPLKIENRTVAVAATATRLRYLKQFDRYLIKMQVLLSQWAWLFELRAIRAKGSTNTSRVINANEWYQVWRKEAFELSVQNPDNLTRKEITVLSLISDGEEVSDVSAKMGIKDQSVLSYIKKLYKKTGLVNRVQLRKYAEKHGYVELI